MAKAKHLGEMVIMGMLLGYLKYHGKYSLHGIASLAGEGGLNLGKKLFFSPGFAAVLPC